MPILLARQSTSAGGIMQSVSDAKTAFSSWDGCMSKAYCKWPVIAGLIIGALIAFSILWCFVRCLCCGKALPSRHKEHKHLDSVPSTPYNNQYQSPPQPIYQQNAFAQTATFDSSTKIHADSLPAMPSWETAASKKIEVLEEPEKYEMDRLKQDRSPGIGGQESPAARPIPMRNQSGPKTLAAAPSPAIPAVGYGGSNSDYGSRQDLGVRSGNDRYETDRYANSPYGAGSSQGYGNNSSSNYGNNATGYNTYGSGQSRSPVYNQTGGTAYNDFASNDRYDNQGRSSPHQNAGYQTYNGGGQTNGYTNTSNNYNSNSNQYSSQSRYNAPGSNQYGYGR
ncbi:hypothetical protein BT63DRAFT_442474 [Microthyrium microscopicum]|uniref:Uncharacterized protein n=1 Tax=Microthyrium microscopicum TaxID=703497 RepID=A0A6A6U3L4_9PEZI|nr:hypothetical protein BT63DRAFT_442474 [Microthyrium microscopicum]